MNIFRRLYLDHKANHCVDQFIQDPLFIAVYAKKEIPRQVNIQPWHGKTIRELASKSMVIKQITSQFRKSIQEEFRNTWQHHKSLPQWNIHDLREKYHTELFKHQSIQGKNEKEVLHCRFGQDEDTITPTLTPIQKLLSCFIRIRESS